MEPRPIFLCGPSRSGTAMLRSALNLHKNQGSNIGPGIAPTNIPPALCGNMPQRLDSTTGPPLGLPDDIVSFIATRTFIMSQIEFLDTYSKYKIL